MHDILQALADALADAAMTEEELADQLTAMRHEAFKLGCHELQDSLLKIGRRHSTAAIKHRAVLGSIVYHHAAVSRKDEDPDLA